jgi:ABC-type transport system involved in multi-copper enzyme maturation permease subunit
MKWLFWKDFRLNWLIVIMALFVVVVPHLIAVSVTCYAKLHNYNDGSAYFSKTLLLSAYASLAISSIVFAFMGGNAIACERSDRSAEFLAYLPISRGKIVASKLLVALSIGGFIWIINFSIFWLCLFSFPSDNSGPLPMKLFAVMTGGFLTAGMTFFCVAWFFSSLMQSPAISAGIGMFTIILLAYAFVFIAHFFVGDENITIIWPVGLAIALSSASFVGGTWYYLRRVEP